jgi:hypothetical protein
MSRSPRLKSQRRIEPSGTGRLAFRPGKKHSLDVQIKEAQEARKELEEQLTLFTEELQALAPLQELAARLEAEEEELRKFLGEHYRDYFHQEHIEATLLWLRRRRATARLQAARAALSLAQELLAPDPLVDQLQDLLSEKPAEEVEVEQERITGHAKAVREHLARYEERLREIRAGITRGNGWIERFFVKKRGFKPEVIGLASALYWEREEGRPVPAEVEAAVHPEIAACLRERKAIPLLLKEEATQEQEYGPYFKYRWREGDSPIYTISLGRISERPEGMLPFRPYIRFARE